MIHDDNGVPLAAVIRKRLIPLPDTEDMDFGLQHSKYVSHDDEIIERAPILDRKKYDQNATSSGSGSGMRHLRITAARGDPLASRIIRRTLCNISIHLMELVIWDWVG